MKKTNLELMTIVDLTLRPNAMDFLDGLFRLLLGRCSVLVSESLTMVHTLNHRAYYMRHLSDNNLWLIGKATVFQKCLYCIGYDDCHALDCLRGQRNCWTFDRFGCILESTNLKYCVKAFLMMSPLKCGKTTDKIFRSLRNMPDVAIFTSFVDAINAFLILFAIRGLESCSFKSVCISE